MHKTSRAPKRRNLRGCSILSRLFQKGHCAILHRLSVSGGVWLALAALAWLTMVKAVAGASCSANAACC